MTFLKRRSDGLALTGVAADANPSADAVPTHVALTLGLRGYSNLDVNANTLDLLVQDTQVGGFNNTSQFFEKYNLEYVSFRVKNGTDLSSNFDGATKTFTASATNAGESFPWLEMVLDDNGRLSTTNAPLNLQFPDKYNEAPAWNLWSITDDGTHGTATARRWMPRPSATTTTPRPSRRRLTCRRRCSTRCRPICSPGCSPPSSRRSARPPTRTSR